MKDQDKTKEQLIDELAELRQRVAELEASEAERKQTEEALWESEAHFRILAEGSIQGILVHQNTKPLFANKAYANILGYESPDDILGMESVVPLIAPYEQERLLSYHRARLKGAYAPNHYEYDALCKDGSIITLQNIVTMVNWTNEPAVLATVIDVTERKRAEEALRESEERLSSFMNSASDSFYLLDSDLNFVEINAKGLEIIGKSREEVIGKNIADVVPDVRESGRYEQHLEVIRTGQPFVIDDHIPHPVFGDLHFVLKSFKVRDGLGVIASDITERKQAEEEIERLAKFPSENPNPVLRVARDGIILYANLASQPLLNAWGCQVGQLLPDDWRDFALDAFSSGSHREAEIEYEDCIFSLTFAPVVGADYGNVYGLDVTQRKGAEEALRESEGLLRTIAANYPAYLSIIERGEEGMTIGFTSGKEFTRLDLDPDAFVGLTLEDVFGEQAPTVRQHYLDAFGGEEVSFELFINDQHQFYSVVPLYDGDEVTALLAVVENITERVQAEKALRELNVTLEARVKERTTELQAQYAQLDAILSSATDGIVVTDREGNITQANPVAQTWLAETLSLQDAERLQEAMRDLAQRADERPVMALELTEQDLEVSAAPVVEDGAEEPLAAVVDIHDISPFKALDRMKTMFIANIAHELRTPVSTVKSYAYLMKRTPPEDEKWGRYLDALVQETDQQVRLVEDVMQVSRIYTGRLEIEPRPTPLTELTEVVGASYRALAQERGVTLVHLPKEPAPVALADPRQMLPALDYLVGDAIRYTPEGGRVTISTERRETEGSVWATVEVSDTGDVIPAEDLPHIFERFFREGEPRSVRVSDTGLRLMIVKGIVELHSGRVTVESEEGIGSAFTVWLPLASH
jgi:PAS domain S-box-containing protein